VKREPPPEHVFVGSLAEIDPRKVAEVVRRSRDIRSLQYSAIRSDIGSPIIIRFIECHRLVDDVDEALFIRQVTLR